MSPSSDSHTRRGLERERVAKARRHDRHLDLVGGTRDHRYAALALAAEQNANASVVNQDVEFCFRYDHTFTDATNFANQGDFPESAGVRYFARGAKFTLTDDLGAVTWHWASLVDGCETVSLSPQRDYTVRLYTHANLEAGNVLKVMKDDAQNLVYGGTADTSLSPSAGLNNTYTWPPNPGGNYTNDVSTVMAAATTTLRHQRVTSNETFKIFFNDSTGGCNASFKVVSGEGRVFPTQSWAQTDKFVVSHELGHLMSYKLQDDQKIGSMGGNSSSYELVPISVVPNASWCANGNHNERDWRGSFWAILTACDITFSQLADIWADAEPQTWSNGDPQEDANRLSLQLAPAQRRTVLPRILPGLHPLDALGASPNRYRGPLEAPAT